MWKGKWKDDKALGVGWQEDNVEIARRWKGEKPLKLFARAVSINSTVFPNMPESRFWGESDKIARDKEVTPTVQHELPRYHWMTSYEDDVPHFLFKFFWHPLPRQFPGLFPMLMDPQSINPNFATGHSQSLCGYLLPLRHSVLVDCLFNIFRISAKTTGEWLTLPFFVN